MAKLPTTFNTDGHGEMGFDPLPKGDYLMKIVKSDYKENSKKNGHFVMLQREVIEGKYKGRVLFANMNIDHPNAQAREIANKEFSASCRACGKVTVEETSDLHGIPHIVSLVVIKGKGDEPDRNKIVAIKPVQGAAVVQGGPSSLLMEDEEESDAPKAEKPRNKAIFEDDDEEEEEVDVDDQQTEETEGDQDHPMFEDD